MKAAIPLFGSRVSPRFGCAAEILIADADAGADDRRVLACAGMQPHELAARLADMGVQTVICAGISCHHESVLAARGITVVRGIVGDAEAVLGAWRANDLKSGALGASRYRGGCHGRRRGHCGPPWMQPRGS